MVTLNAITHDGPVIVREVGKAHGGLVWTVQPDRFDALVEMVNKFGGPDFWTITPA